MRLHTGAVQTPKECALKAESGRKIPCRTGESNRIQYCVWLFNPALYQMTYPLAWVPHLGLMEGTKSHRRVFSPNSLREDNRAV